jgi:hypothetical protein
MEPNEEQIRELMTTVACAVCGSNYQASSIEVLGHRNALWFLKVTCLGCSTCGLVAAMVKSQDGADSEISAPAESSPPDRSLDSPRAPGPVTRSHVTQMRDFLTSFDGNFQSLFSSETQDKSQKPAA